MNKIIYVGEDSARIYPVEVYENSKELTELEKFLIDNYGFNSLNPINLMN